MQWIILTQTVKKLKTISKRHLAQHKNIIKRETLSSAHRIILGEFAFTST